MENEELILIRWHIDRSVDPCIYMLVSQDPKYADLNVSVSSDEMTERVAKARLMERMYALGDEKGIPARRLRFRINGIEE